MKCVVHCSLHLCSNALGCPIYFWLRACFLWESGLAREGNDHLPSYARLRKWKLLTLHSKYNPIELSFDIALLTGSSEVHLHTLVAQMQ